MTWERHVPVSVHNGSVEPQIDRVFDHAIHAAREWSERWDPPRNIFEDSDGCTVKKVIKDAKAYLNDGEIQKARPLVANLASEIQYRTLHIPLATYPSAIKAIAPLIDAGKIDDAKAALQAVLNTPVVTTDEVVPLPKLRAEHLLKEALAEKKDRSKEENDKLAKHLQGAREQLQMARTAGVWQKERLYPHLRTD